MSRRPTVDLRHHLPPAWRGHRGVEVPPEVVTAAFAEALDALALAGVGDAAGGGGVLAVPPGRWRVTVSERSPHAGILVETRGTTIRGAGIRATRIELASDASAHTVSIRAGRHDGAPTPDDITIERCTIVGNRAVHVPKAGGHGVSVRDSAAFVRLRDVVVEDAAANALGMERTGEHRGVFDGVSLRNVTLLRSGRSAIDIKNYDVGAPASSGGRSWIRGLSVDGVALAWDEGDPQGAQHALHLRGQRHLQNVEVRGRRGIWFLNSPGGPVNGRGAQRSTLENYLVEVSGPVGISARAADVRASDAHWRLVTDPRDLHDPRVLPLAGVRYWTWTDAAPRRLRTDRFTDPAGGLPSGWVLRRGSARLGADGLVLAGDPDGGGAGAGVEVGCADVDVTWRLVARPEARPVLVVRDDGPAGRVAVAVDAGAGRLALQTEGPQGRRTLGVAEVAWPAGPVDVRVRASGDHVEVAVGDRAPCLRCDLDRSAPRGTAVGLEDGGDGAVAWRSVQVLAVPEPRWAGSVRRVASVEPPDLVRPDRGAVPAERFVGSFRDLTGVLDGPASKDVVAFELDDRGLTTAEFEIHGESAPWLAGARDARVWMAASGGPAVRSARQHRDADGALVLEGVTPVQVVQRRRRPGPGERTEQARHPTRLWIRLEGDRAVGTAVAAPVPGAFCGFRLEFVARRRPSP